MDGTLDWNHDFDQPPPEYPGDAIAVARVDSQFKLPSFDDVMALYEFEDSIRLPAYSARPIRRYHPYLRFRRPVSLSHFDETSRYYNTIFDESYVPLEVPPLVSQDAFRPLAMPTNELMVPNGIVIPPAPVTPPPPAPATELATFAEFEAYVDALWEQEEQRRRRLRRLWYLLPVFLYSVRHALDAVDGAAVDISRSAEDN